MKFSDLFKKYGAYLVAAVIFFALAYIYCSPVLGGKTLNAGDAVNGSYYGRDLSEYRAETGDISWWTGSVFSGMPAYQIAPSYKSDKLKTPLNVFVNGDGSAAWVLVLYFICFFVLMRSFGINKWLSIVAALATGFSSYFLTIIAAGHIWKTMTIALTAVVFAGFYLIFRKKYILGFILTMLFVAMGFSIHPQMFYYYCMMIGLCWFAELAIHIKSGELKSFGLGTLLFVLAIGIGIGTGSASVFANAEYLGETMRGGQTELEIDASDQNGTTAGLELEYATQWSYGIDETMSLMIPGFMGGANSVNVGKDSQLYESMVKNGVAAHSAADFCKHAPLYWGEQPFTAGNVYIGAIVCFLFLLGLLIVEGPYKWALLAATLFSLALSWGHNCMWLTEFFFRCFPMYNKFRAVSSILIVAEIAMPLLGFLSVRQIMEGRIDKEKLFRKLYLAGGVAGGICLFLALFGGMLFSFTSTYDASWSNQLPDWLYAAIVEQRADLLRSDSWRSFIFIAGAFSSIWLYAKSKIKSRWLIVVLGLLVVFDMWPVNKRYFNNDNFAAPKQIYGVTMMPYEEQILQDKEPHFRVMNLTTDTFNENRTSYYFESVGGYSAAKLRRYQDLISEHLSKLHWPVIGMLNAKYLILPGEDGNPVVSKNPYALGNAWFVDHLEVADNPRNESDALNVIDLSHEAVVDKSFSAHLGNLNPSIPGDAKVSLTEYTPKTLDYDYSSSESGTIVFSEIYYPYGWKTTIDGNPVEHFRANYVLRALNVPAGDHHIQFVFDPDSVRKGDRMATICVVIMYLLTLAAMAYGFCKSFGKLKNAKE